MTLSAADLDAYFARVGFAGAPAPDRATLAEIVRCHAQAIAFENLDPLLGRTIELAPEALMAKLVHGGRGGYCFEANGLFQLVLERIGFTVTGLAARVLWGQAEDAVPMLGHKLLLVALPEGPAAVDVGFGGNTPTGVLDLVADVVQPTPHEAFRFVRRGAEWWQQARIAGAWCTTYRFDLRPQLAIDYDAVNWWSATHPQSLFTRNLIAARPLPGRRLALLNRDFAIHSIDGGTERRQLSGAAETCDVLAEEFGIRLPDRAELEAGLTALFEGT